MYCTTASVKPLMVGGYTKGTKEVSLGLSVLSLLSKALHKRNNINFGAKLS
jgi:hypothetical protein